MAQRGGREETEEKKKRDQEGRREREREDINIPAAAGIFRMIFLSLFESDSEYSA